MAFNGVVGFSCGVCACAETAVSDRIIGAINQFGNEFILIFLFVAQAQSSRILGLILALALSENDFHPVVGNTCFEAGLGGDNAKLWDNFALVAGDNLRTAMGDDRVWHAFLSAPCQLRANRCMPNETFSALADEQAGQGCAVADVNLHAFERCRAIVDEDESRRVEIRACPALTRYPTAGARMECSTGNASNRMPEIFVGVRSLMLPI